MPESKRPLRVFLCHASQDKPVVRELSQRLASEGWIDPWLDEKKLLPGQDWRLKIEEAVEISDIVIICLSSNSVSKEGFVQKELRYAREIALEKPEETIFLIPLRLDECDVPRGLRFYQWADYFGEKKEETYSALIESLKLRHEQRLRLEEKERARKEKRNRSTKVAEKAARARITREKVERGIVEGTEENETKHKVTEKHEIAGKVEKIPLLKPISLLPPDTADQSKQSPIVGLASPSEPPTFEPIGINSNSIVRGGRVKQEKHAKSTKPRKVTASTTNLKFPSWLKRLLGYFLIAVIVWLAMTNLDKWMLPIIKGVDFLRPSVNFEVPTHEIATQAPTSSVTPFTPAATRTPTLKPISSKTFTPVSSIPTDYKSPAVYTIQVGEFPSCLARRFNIDLDELLKANGLANSSIIIPGYTFILPQNGKPFPADRALQSHPTTYTVQSVDETLSSIACNYGDVYPEEIALLNELQLNSELTVGQVLRIP